MDYGCTSQGGVGSIMGFSWRCGQVAHGMSIGSSTSHSQLLVPPPRNFSLRFEEEDDAKEDHPDGR